MTLSNEWTTHRLGDIAITQSGGTPGRIHPEFYDGTIPWVKSGELADCEILDTEEHITPEAIEQSSAKLFDPDTLLVAMYGATVGQTAILKVRAATNQAVCAIVPKNERFSVRFVQYYFIFRRQDLLKERYGGAQPNISQQIIRNFAVTLPPLPEQKKIATVLSKLQRAIELQERLIQSLRDLKKSAMNHLFTHGLRGEKLRKTEIGLMPQSWEMKRFLDFVELHRGYDLPVQERADGIIPIIGANGVVGHHSQARIKGPGVATGRSGTIGISFYVEEDYWPLNTALYVSDFKGSHPRYVHYFFEQFNFGRFAAGVSVPTLNRNPVHDALVAVPLTSEQTEIAHILQTIDKKLEKHESQKASLQALFKTMLNKLMTGQVRVKDLDIDTAEVKVA